MLSIPCNSHGYRVNPVRTTAEQGVVNRLVHRMYAWRGYSMQSSLYRSNNPNLLTLAVWRADQVMATITIGCDSAEGLLADTLYAQELNTLRQSGRIVCEVTRLAVHPDLRSEGAVNTLFRVAFAYGREKFGGTDAVIEVNPRHVRFYQRRFGFQLIGKQRQCPRVKAPAVLLHQTLDGFMIHGVADYPDGLPEEWSVNPPLAEAV